MAAKLAGMAEDASTLQTSQHGKSGRVWVFYHYLFPDDVVSAIHMDQLCQGLEQRGWAVTGFSGNRSCREDGVTYPPSDLHQGVEIERVWRPPFRQSSSSGRLLNAVWMVAAWSLLALRSDPPDTILIGTDPILSVLTALSWKFFSPETRIVHWCFDLYPEAAFADGLLSPDGVIARILTPLLRQAYRACDLILDIGTCMRQRLAVYASPARVETIVPWALEEKDGVLLSADEERIAICGDARLAMLYSGNFGRAHTFHDFLSLAGAMRNESAALTFSVRGNREAELRAAVGQLQEQPGSGKFYPDKACQIRFAPFAPTERLLDRLAAPDIHLLSLAPDWTGLVVPSKFFGALAIGRPVLFSGSLQSSIAQWIAEYDLGWVLTPDNVDLVAADLLRYRSDPERIAATQQRCFATYQAQFSRTSGLDRFHALLTGLL